MYGVWLRGWRADIPLLVLEQVLQFESPCVLLRLDGQPKPSWQCGASWMCLVSRSAWWKHERSMRNVPISLTVSPKAQTYGRGRHSMAGGSTSHGPWLIKRMFGVATTWLGPWPSKAASAGPSDRGRAVCSRRQCRVPPSPLFLLPPASPTGHLQDQSRHRKAGGSRAGGARSTTVSSRPLILTLPI